MTLSRIEPATFRLVAQCLNKLRYLLIYLSFIHSSFISYFLNVFPSSLLCDIFSILSPFSPCHYSPPPLPLFSFLLSRQSARKDRQITGFSVPHA